MTKASVISLFSGAGGLDLGLESAGFRIEATIELDKLRCETLVKNRPKWNVIKSDIRALSGNDILSRSECDEVDLVAAGPPCQPFSKSAYWITEGRVVDIANSQLLFEPARIAEETGARAVLIENVPGLSYRHARPMLDQLLERLKRAGYRTTWQVLDAADFGVPQHRKRLLILGMRDEEPVLPHPARRESQDYVTAGSAIDDLDNGSVSAEEKVEGKYGDLLCLIPPGSNYIHLTERGAGDTIFRYRSKYWSFLLKLSPDRPSWTIAARVGSYTGPFHWDNRRLHVSELKRLQTIPDDWLFSGSYRCARRQIGDAVPPLLAEELGTQISKQLIG